MGMKARGSAIRVSFKNIRESSRAISGKKVSFAKQILKGVLDHQRCILFHRYTGGVGRTAQARNGSSSSGQGRWPVQSAKILLRLLNNAESNAEFQAISTDNLFVSNVL